MFKKEKLLISAITLSVLGVSINGRLFASEENFIKQHYSLNKKLYSCICTVFNEHIRQKSNTCKNYWANKLKWKGSIDALKKITTLSHQIDDTGYKAISQSYKGTINKLIQEITKAKKENTHYKENLNKMKALFNGWGAFEIIKMFWTLPNLNDYRDDSERKKLYRDICYELVMSFGVPIYPLIGIKENHKKDKGNSKSPKNEQNETKLQTERDDIYRCELADSFVHDMQCYLEQFWVICNKVIEKTEHESIIAKVRRDFPPNAQKSKDWNYGVTREFSQKITDPSSMQNAVLQSIVHIAPLASKFNKYYRRGVFVKNEKGDREKVNVGKTAKHLFEITNAVWSDYEAGKSINAKVDLKQKNDNDPIEFFNSLLDKLHSDLSPNIYGRTNDQPPAPQIIECKENENDIIKKQFDDYCRKFKNNNNTVISDLFYVTCLKWEDKNKFQFISKETLTVPIAEVYKYNLERKKYDKITTNTITLDDFFKYFKDRECTELTVVPDILTFCVDWENLTDNLPSFSPEFSLSAKDYINSVIQNECSYGDDTNATYFLAGIVTKDENTEKFVYYNRMSENMSWYQYTEKEVTKVENEAFVQNVITKNANKADKDLVKAKNIAIENVIQQKKPYILIYQRRPDANKLINNNIMINSNNNINHVFRTQKKPNFMASSVKNNNANSNINLENKNNNISQNNNMNNFNNLNNNINMNYNIQNMNTFQNNQNLGNMNVFNNQNNQFFYPSMNNQFVTTNSNNFAPQNYNVNNQSNNGNYNNQINNMNSQQQNGYGFQNTFNAQNNIGTNYSNNGTNNINQNMLTINDPQDIFNKHISNYGENSRFFVDLWREMHKDVKLSKQTVGLDNIGSTCYMNATLQCFAHLDPLISYLITKRNSDENFGTNLNKIPMTYSFLKTVMNLRKINLNKYEANYSNCKLKLPSADIDNIKNAEISSYAPYDFREEISKNPIFQQVAANDAKDLVNHIIMTMHEELNSKRQDNQFQNGNMLDMKLQNDKQRIKQAFMEEYKNGFKSIISDLLYAVQGTETQCETCGNTQYNYQAYFFLVFPLEEVRKFTSQNVFQQLLLLNSNCRQAVEMGNIKLATFLQPQLSELQKKFYNLTQSQRSIVTIDDCFVYNGKWEYFTGSNQIYCNNCGNMSNAGYRTELENTPEILIILLNRGNGIQFKIDLDFPEVLNVTPYVVDKSTVIKYQLIATVTHLGESGASGHFVANCRCSDGNWRRYNDSIVQDIKDYQSEVVKFAMPYILFYEKIH